MSQSILDKLVATDGLASFLRPESFAALAVVVLLLWLGKLARGWLTRAHDLNRLLTTEDNKAAAVSFTGYMVGLATILFRVVTTPSDDFLQGLVDLAAWGAIGIVLLNLSAWIHEKSVLGAWGGTKEIVDNGNIATGSVEGGGFIGTGFIIGACVGGESAGWADSLVTAAVFFVLGQLALILWSLVYRKMAGHGLRGRIPQGNVAAGVAAGLSLAAFGIALSHPIAQSASVVLFALWTLVGMISLSVLRVLVDWLIFPRHSLNQEIREDQNWGAGLIEGGLAVSVAFLLRGAF